MFIHVGSYGRLLSNDTNKSDNIVCLSEQEPHLWNWPKSRHDRNWYLFLAAISNIESREKASKLSFWWSDDNLWKNMLCCVYILTYAINVLCCIELLITYWAFWLLLVFHSINYHSINYRTHQKVTKMLNKVINS